MTRVFIAVYLIEAGLILAWSPWTAWWRRNYFADVVPQLGVLMGTQGMRAAVVTIGVLTVVVGAADLWMVLSRRFRGGPAPGDAPKV